MSLPITPFTYLSKKSNFPSIITHFLQKQTKSILIYRNFLYVGRLIPPPFPCLLWSSRASLENNSCLAGFQTFAVNVRLCLRILLKQPRHEKPFHKKDVGVSFSQESRMLPAFRGLDQHPYLVFWKWLWPKRIKSTYLVIMHWSCMAYLKSMTIIEI